MTRIEDKNGEELKVGDTIEFVWAGEHHRAKIEKLHPSDFGHHSVEVSISAFPSPGSVAKVHQHHKKEETEDTAGEKPQPRETTTHRSRSSTHTNAKTRSTNARRK